MSRANTPVSPVSSSKTGTGCVRFFLLPFFAFGCFFFYFIFLQPLWSIWRAQNWVTVPCRIVSSEVKASRGSKSTTYKPLIRYSYQVDGQEFQSERHDFISFSSSGFAWKKEIVDRYPPGSQAICFVNPENPMEAVLHRGPTHSLWWGLFPLPFMAIGSLAFMPARFFQAKSSQNSPLKNTARRKLPLPDEGSGHVDGAVGGPVELRASASPMAKLIGLIVFAVFWNGIVSVFVWMAWKGISRGRPEWFLIIFLIPFVVIGLAAIFGVGYSFLNLFNPRINLVVSSAAIPLGGVLNAQWSFRGNARRLRDLKIVLEGLERATYRRGTDTTTDEHIFTKIPLVETSDSAVISAGSARVTIPANLMHSFNAVNNKIIWRLKVSGNIPRFPDVNEEFAFTVLPHVPNPS